MLDTAIRQDAPQVPRTVRVDACIRRIGEEGRLCRRRLAPITEGEIAAFHRDLADTLLTHCRSGVIEEQDLCIIQREAYGHQAAGDWRILVNEIPANTAGFSDAQPVDQHAVRRKMSSVPLDVLRVQWLPPR